MTRLFRWSLFAALFLALSAASFGQVLISVRVGPPALPVYAQPICPGPGYLWTPGYWAWDDDGGYYWVPGTWVMAPVGLLWTPGYWGWNNGFYVWHAGYWGPHVGFYGGINYGFGYTGVGFFGGEWRGREFFYNRTVTNINVVNVTHVYNRTVVVNNVNRVSFNGGAGGVMARPTREEESAMREHHTEPLAVQREHHEAASRNRELFARENHGRPTIAATERAADFNHHEPAKAAGGEYREPKMSPREARGPEKMPLNPRENVRNEHESRTFNPPPKSEPNARSQKEDRRVEKQVQKQEQKQEQKREQKQERKTEREPEHHGGKRR